LNIFEYHEWQIDLYYLILSKKAEVARNNTRNLSVEQGQTVFLIRFKYVFVLRLGNINQLFRACHRHHSARILASLHRGDFIVEVFEASLPVSVVTVF
jgi:hypothetical protein